MFGRASLSVAAGALLASLAASHAGVQATGAEHPLAERAGWPVTSGAAPGYVPDLACADCHADLWQSYQHVGMARSFARVSRESADGDFSGAEFFHELSGNHYANVQRGDAFFQQRWREDAEGRRYAEHEQKIDWVVGSGSKVQTYLYQTPSGELFQLPVSWYADPGRWRMSPGYDVPVHEDFRRRISRQCMFCHDAYPDVPAGSDGYGDPLAFPHALPEGIGCQRCHGPGAEHVALALERGADDERIRASIVNPARLAPRLRDDVCFQCHLQPVSIVGNTVLQPGRGAYSFVPGTPLDDYHVQFDVSEPLPASERFEINHHAYRLRQSRCYQESGTALTCTTCHDPHVKVTGEQRAEHYRAKCLECHASEDCSVGPMEASLSTDASGAHGGARSDATGAGAEATGASADATGAHADATGASAEASRAGAGGANEAALAAQRGDCVACHMPKRRPRDVIQATMTDHLIRREPAPRAWLDPLPELVAIDVAGIAPYFPDRAPADASLALFGALLETRNRALRGARAGPPTSAMQLVRQLVRAIRATPSATADAWLDLGNAHFDAGELDLALEVLAFAARRFPAEGEIHRSLGGALAVSGDHAAALAEFERARALLGEEPDLLFGRAASLARTGSQDALREAVAVYRRGLELRPNDALAHYELAVLHLVRGDLESAITELELAAQIEPATPHYHRVLGDAYAERPDWARALRAWSIAAASTVDDLDLARKLAFVLLACPEAELRDDAAGLAQAELAARIAPEDCAARALLALGRLLASDWPGALTAARESKLLGADPVVCESIAALCLDELGSAADASRSRALATQALAEETPVGPLRPRVLELVARAAPVARERKTR